MIAIKKRAMTLLELLVSLSLAMILLATLAFFYKDITKLTALSEKIELESFSERYLQSRLNQVIPFALSERQLKEEFYFFTTGKNKQQHLIFVFENGPDLDPNRAGNVLARLFIDPKERLCLATWPEFKEWGSLSPTPRVEVLLENVKGLSFEFYVPPHVDSLDPDQWLLEWSRDYQFLPPLVKMHVDTGQIKTYPFYLPRTQQIITYTQD